MSVLQVLHIPDERLRKVAKPVEEVNAEIRRIVDDMFETMYAEKGIGLAATQVDIHQRIIVIDVSENRDILTRLLQGKGEVAHEAAVAANVAMLMRLHGEEDLKANAQKVLNVLRSGAAYDRVTALAARG